MKKITSIFILSLTALVSNAGTVRVYTQTGWEGGAGNYLTVARDKPSVLRNVTPSVRECSAEKEEDGGITIGLLRCRQVGSPDVSTMCTTGKDGMHNAVLIFGNQIDVDPKTGNATAAVPVIVAINCIE